MDKHVLDNICIIIATQHYTYLKFIHTQGLSLTGPQQNSLDLKSWTFPKS
jgi:hypothetical protein